MNERLTASQVHVLMALRTWMPADARLDSFNQNIVEALRRRGLLDGYGVAMYITQTGRDKLDALNQAREG